MSGLIRTDLDYQEMLYELRCFNGGWVAIDTETTGLKPYVCDEIRGISVATRDHEWYLPLTHPDSSNFNHNFLARALTRFKFTFHHAVFDWAFLAQIGPEAEWWLERTEWDTQVVNWLMDENLPVGLKPSTSRIFGIDTAEEQAHLKSLKGKTWATYSAEDIGTYAALDARLTYDLRVWQEEYLPHRTPDVRPAIDRGLETQRSLFKMIRQGIVVNPDTVAEGEAAMLERLDVMNGEFKGQGVNPTSPKDVGRWLYDEKGYDCPIYTRTGKRSTAVAALTALAEHGCTEAESLLEHRKLQKAVTAYFRPMQASIGDDGRVHAHFSSTRTVTGRFSCSAPNFQTIPQAEKLPEVRACFEAAPGLELWEYDLKQAELRVIAGYANEPAMIDALESGRDLHSETALAMFGPDFTKLQRRLAKNLNFGFAYGIGPAKFATYMAAVPTECDGWRIKGATKCRRCDVCSASRILDGYRETYPRLSNLLTAMGRIAVKRGYVPSTVPGRFRHFKGAGYRVKPYTAVNYIVQGGIAEFMIDMMNEWYRDPYPNATLCLQIHDAFVFEVAPGWGPHLQVALQGIADRLNPFKMRMEFDAKEWT